MILFEIELPKFFNYITKNDFSINLNNYVQTIYINLFHKVFVLLLFKVGKSFNTDGYHGTYSI